MADGDKKTDMERYNEEKMYQGERKGRAVADMLQRLDAMSVDEYIEGIRAHFISSDAIENFMRILMSCKDETASTIVVRGKKYRVEPRKSAIFKKTFAEFLVREPKIELGQYVKDPITLLAYGNALQHTPRTRKAASLADVFG